MDQLFSEMNAQNALLPQLVQYWMNWMFFVFVASILFVWRKKTARYVLLALLLAIPVNIAMFYFTANVHLMGVAHLIFWTPLLYYLLKFEIKKSDFELMSVYGIWISSIILTVIISLIFDFRALVLAIFG